MSELTRRGFLAGASAVMAAAVVPTAQVLACRYQAGEYVAAAPLERAAVVLEGEWRCTLTFFSMPDIQAGDAVLINGKAHKVLAVTRETVWA